MTKCEDCIKCDVCKNVNTINDTVKSLCLTEQYQQLINNGMEININCKYYLNKSNITTKILRGEN